MLKLLGMIDATRTPVFHVILFVLLGADAILMHSKTKDASQIEEFMRLWKNKASTRSSVHSQLQLQAYSLRTVYSATHTRWDNADAETEVPSAENPELSKNVS